MRTQQKREHDYAFWRQHRPRARPRSGNRISRRAHAALAMYTEEMQKHKVLLSLLACLVASFLVVPAGAQTKTTDKAPAKAAAAPAKGGAIAGAPPGSERPTPQ